MINISKYRVEYNEKEKVFYIWAEEEIVCPVCGCERLKKKGRRKRRVIKPNGEEIVLKIRRLKCKDCKTIHHELPKLLVPYKRYSAQTIEIIINKTYEEVCCENSTINRIKAWWANIQLYIKSVEESIKLKYNITFSKERKLVEIVRALVNTHLWPGTRSAWECQKKKIIIIPN